MKILLTSFGLMACLVLAGAGCLDLDGLPDDSFCWKVTPWDSCIDQYGIDNALLGSWTLQEQTVASPAGTVTNPFAGRILTFVVGEIEIEDFDTGEVIEVLPDPTYAENFTTETAGDCTASGYSGGNWKTGTSVDLNAPGNSLWELSIVTDPMNPVVTCESGGSSAYSNAASTPLGVGPGSHVVNGGYAKATYQYSIDPSHSSLMITTGVGGITNTFIFTR